MSPPAEPRLPTTTPQGGPGVFRIDRDGVWLHDGEPVTHPGVLVNLFANLRREADGGYRLAVGPHQLPVDVADTPLVVTRVEASPQQALTPKDLRLYLTDGSVEPLDPQTLWLDETGVPRCVVRAGQFPARLSIAAWLQLAAFLEEPAQGGPPTLVLAGRRMTLPTGRPSVS